MNVKTINYEGRIIREMRQKGRETVWRVNDLWRKPMATIEKHVLPNTMRVVTEAEAKAFARVTGTPAYKGWRVINKAGLRQLAEGLSVHAAVAGAILQVVTGEAGAATTYPTISGGRS